MSYIIQIISLIKHTMAVEIQNIIVTLDENDRPTMKEDRGWIH